jgi:hypothetical protein
MTVIETGEVCLLCRLVVGWLGVWGWGLPSCQAKCSLLAWFRLVWFAFCVYGFALLVADENF